MLCFKMLETIIFTQRVKSNGGLQTVKKERDILHTKKEEKPNELVTSCVGTAF
jgi:hypothetical protein